MFELLSGLFVSPLWAKLIAAIFLLAFIAKVARKRKLAVLVPLRFLVIFLVAGDLGFYFYPHNIVPMVQHILIITIYLVILEGTTKKRHAGAVFWILNILLIGGLETLQLLGFLPPYLRFVYNLGIMANLIYMAWSFFQVSKYNTHRAGVILDIRGDLIRLSFIAESIILIFGFDNKIIQAVLIPLSYLIPFLVLHQFEKRYDMGQKNKVLTMKDSLKASFDFMITIGNAITEKVEMDTVMTFVAESAVKSTGADGSAILLIDEYDDVLRVKAVHGEFPPPYPAPANVRTKASAMAEFFRSNPIPLGRGILGQAGLGKRFFVKDSAEEPLLEQNSKSDALYISSFIALPLVVGKKILGVLAIISRKSGFRFSPNHLKELKTFGDYTSLAIHNLITTMQLLEKQEMEREVGIAAEIQGQLLPGKLPRVSSVSLAAYSLPAKGVSGDYYDVINLRKGEIMMVMCDVAGKGIPASLVMVMIRTIIHLVARQPDMNVAKVMDIVNWGVAGQIALDRFATMSLVWYDFARKTLQYSNAAHHPLLIYRAALGKFEDMDTEGIPIGLEKRSRYNLLNTKLEKDDIIVLYTDGIIEAMNDKGGQYSLESLQQVVKDNASLSPEKLKKKIIEDVGAFVGKARQHDDQTFLIMKVEN